MILAQAEIREEIERGNIKFDPPLEVTQFAEASVNLRLGLKFTKFIPAQNVKLSLADGMAGVKGTQLWTDEVFQEFDNFGKRRSYFLEHGEFILATTYERMWVPRNLIAMVEGRSTYARFGVSMHQTAPWLQPGWNGHITLEICNNGENIIELTPIRDKPCQVTFFKLTSEVPEDAAYGSRPTDSFQNQMSAMPNQKTGKTS